MLEQAGVRELAHELLGPLGATVLGLGRLSRHVLRAM